VDHYPDIKLVCKGARLVEKVTEHYAKRWYDPDEKLSYSVRVLEKLPEALIDPVCTSVIALAEFEHALHKTLKTLGHEKLMALYKSKQKLRDLDKILTFHSMMNYLSSSPSHVCKALAEHLYEFVQKTEHYLTQCSTRYLLPNGNAVSYLIKTNAISLDSDMQAYNTLFELLPHHPASPNHSIIMRSEILLEDDQKLKSRDF
jgi:hypothetical protein